MKLRNPTDKYLFADIGTGVSMYHPSGYLIPDEEPILIFRAKDLGVLAAMTAYLDMLVEQEPSVTIKDHLISMLHVGSAITEYQSHKNVKSVTCSVKAHQSTVDMLRADYASARAIAVDHLAKQYNYIVKE